MRRVLATAGVGLALVLGACGDDSDEPESAAETTTASVSTTGADISTFSDEELEVLGVARDYINAIGEKDWTGLCDSVTEQLENDLSTTAGIPCDDAVKVIYDSPQFENFAEVFGEAEPESIQIDGDTAEVSYGKDFIFYFVRQDGTWKFTEK